MNTMMSGGHSAVHHMLSRVCSCVRRARDRVLFQAALMPPAPSPNHCTNGGTNARTMNCFADMVHSAPVPKLISSCYLGNPYRQTHLTVCLVIAETKQKDTCPSYCYSNVVVVECWPAIHMKKTIGNHLTVRITKLRMALTITYKHNLKHPNHYRCTLLGELGT